MDDWQDPFEEAPEASAAVATNDRASKSKKHDLPYSGFQQASKIRKQEGGAPAAAPAGGGSEAVINQPAASGLVDKQAAEIAALKKMLKEQAAAAAAAAAVKNAPKEEVQREFQLSKTKKVSVREFRGKTLVDIREYYQKDGGEWAPGRKGISLTREQWEKLKQLVDSIDLAVSNS